VHTPVHSSPTFACIDLGALAHNVAQVRSRLSPACAVLAVVKANAYGHGAVTVTKTLQGLGITRFGVATVEEGAALRAASIDAAILVMGAVTAEEFPDLIAARLTPVLYRPDMVQRFAMALDRHAPDGPRYPVHLKVDTGMGRLGIRLSQLREAVTQPALAGRLHLEGLMSHLADADNQDPAYTHIQIREFEEATALLTSEGRLPPLVHLANSAAILTHPSSHYRLVRPGIMLYGYHTLPALPPDVSLQPVLSWQTTVAHLRTVETGSSVSYNRTFVAKRRSRIAVLPVGYADGYNRLLSNRGFVLVGGKRVPVVGRVCMDMTMIDVTDCPGVEIGDPVMLIGRQEQELISADHMAVWLQTVPYEVLCAIGSRVPRLYHTAAPASPR